MNRLLSAGLLVTRPIAGLALDEFSSFSSAIAGSLFTQVQMATLGSNGVFCPRHVPTDSADDMSRDPTLIRLLRAGGRRDLGESFGEAVGWWLGGGQGLPSGLDLHAAPT